MATKAGKKKAVEVKKFDIAPDADGFQEVSLGEFADAYEFKEVGDTLIADYITDSVKEVECPMKGKGNEGKTELRKLFQVKSDAGINSIWGSAKLAAVVEMAEKGELDGKTLKIVYTGKVKTPRGQMKNFRVFVK